MHVYTVTAASDHTAALIHIDVGSRRGKPVVHVIQIYAISTRSGDRSGRRNIDIPCAHLVHVNTAHAARDSATGLVNFYGITPGGVYNANAVLGLACNGPGSRNDLAAVTMKGSGNPMDITTYRTSCLVDHQITESGIHVTCVNSDILPADGSCHRNLRAATSSIFEM